MAASSSDSETGEEWIPYSERPEWKDVKSIEQDDGPEPVLQIAYSDKFRDVYNYFRAIIAADERSERAFNLTTDAAALNPANYTVWHFRRILLQELKKDLKEELIYITKMIWKHPKNYQVWHHRHLVVKWLNDPSKEIQFTAGILQGDAKNYHTWQHRQWVIRHFGLWDGELDYVIQLISEDPRNNSAWNQRYFVISNTTGFTDKVLHDEILYTTGIIKVAPNNESPWNYLRGILQDRQIADQPTVTSFCEKLYADSIRSPHLLSFMIDWHEEMLDKAGSKEGAPQSLSTAVDLCKQLANETDTIRQEYWSYVGRSLMSRYG